MLMPCLSFAYDLLLIKGAIAKFLQDLHLFIKLCITFYSDESEKRSRACQPLAKR